MLLECISEQPRERTSQYQIKYRVSFYRHRFQIGNGSVLRSLAFVSPGKVPILYLVEFSGSSTGNGIGWAMRGLMFGLTPTMNHEINGHRINRKQRSFVLSFLLFVPYPHGEGSRRHWLPYDNLPQRTLWALYTVQAPVIQTP